jgi:DNA-binding NarL/FixJ family response regulator
MPTIRVLLIEDNLLLRDGAAAILNEQEDIRAVAVGGSNGDAMSKTKSFKPHIVLLDIGLRNMNSLNIVQSLKKQYPAIAIIIMDLVPTHAEVAEFVDKGASGFILKDASLHEFLNTIRTVAKGVRVPPPSLANSLFSHIVEHALQMGGAKKIMDAVRLTKREHEVIDLVAKGQSNKQIATNLIIATHTVKSHVHNVLEKLALRTRHELAHFVFERDKVKST